MRFLVTAGSTYEMIDAVRHWGNIFTGNTGLRIARQISSLGEVDLLTSNQAHIDAVASETSIHASRFKSHADLKRLLTQKMAESAYDAVFMSAAVSDFRPAGAYSVIERKRTANGREQWIVENVQSDKVKSIHQTIAVLGEKTVKLVDLFRSEWGYRGLLVKFKLEVGISNEQLVAIGQSSRISSGADYLVANTLSMVDGPSAGAYLLNESGEEWVARDALPARLEQLVRQHLG